MSDAGIHGLEHIGIRVHDLDRSRRFYEGVLGFEFIAGPLGPEPVALLKHPAGLTLNLILNADAAEMANLLMDVPQKSPGYTHMALVVEDVTATMQHLEASGVTITEGPVEFPGTRAIFVRDPDGNTIEFDELIS